jgi:hypothetical protein
VTPDEKDQLWASMYRIRAGAHRVAAARNDMYAKLIEASSSLRHFTEAFIASETHDFAQHPDLAELDAQMDGFYGSAE